MTKFTVKGQTKTGKNANGENIYTGASKEFEVPTDLQDLIAFLGAEKAERMLRVRLTVSCQDQVRKAVQDVLSKNQNASETDLNEAVESATSDFPIWVSTGRTPAAPKMLKADKDRAANITLFETMTGAAYDTWPADKKAQFDAIYPGSPKKETSTS